MSQSEGLMPFQWAKLPWDISMEKWHWMCRPWETWYSFCALWRWNCLCECSVLSCGAVLLLGCQSAMLFAWYCSVSSSTVNFTLCYLRYKAGSPLGVLLATSAAPDGWVNVKMLLQEAQGSTTTTDSRCGKNWIKMPSLHFLLPGNLGPASSTYPSQCFQCGKDQL